jgi:hypothetical protein
MDTQRDPSPPANSASASPTADEARTTASTTSTSATLLPLRSAVPALTLLAVRFAAGELGPLEFVINSTYGAGGH